MKMPEFVLPGEKLGHKNREAVRWFFVTHPGCSQIDCAKALGLSVVAVNRHVKRLRAEWKNA
jgi:predicted transcriptional regulator